MGEGLQRAFAAAKRTRAPKLPALTEKQVTEQVIGWLKANGWLCVRLQSGLVDLPGNRKMRVGTPGLPDWICCNHDRYFFLEVKSPIKVPSPIQNEWMNSARRQGITAIWANGLGSLMVQMEAIWTR